MFNIIRRIATLLSHRPDSDERHFGLHAGPLIDILEADLAHLDNLTHVFAGRRSRG